MLDIEILVVWLHHLRKYVELSINLMFLNMKVQEEIKIELKFTLFDLETSIFLGHCYHVCSC